MKIRTPVAGPALAVACVLLAINATATWLVERLLLRGARYQST